MRERLFNTQDPLDVNSLAGDAAAGLNPVAFQQCLSMGKYADLAFGAKLNVRGTPTFFFGYPDEKDLQNVKAVKLVSGAQPLNVFTDILDALLETPKSVPAVR